ncbi:MAG: YbhB/YbcL family Raf kinase inhibitor-like protein [Gammaproteobacteria bacterium]
MTKFLTLCMAGLLAASSAQALVLTSPDFADGGAIPTKYTCNGANISPALQWSVVPPATEAFAVIMRDPDAANKNWIHWVMYNLPLGTTSIPDNYQAKIDGALMGKNSWNTSTYRGPCPPTGTHHYRFELYALDQALYVNPDLTAAQLSDAMQGHILGMAILNANYSKH